MIHVAAGVASRFLASNFHVVEAGAAWRVARGKLSDERLRAIVVRHGIRNVVDLRSPLSSAPDMAGIDFDTLGVRFENLHLRASVLPPPSVVARFAELITRDDGPFLFVCKRGKDKTGFASALWRVIRSGDTPARAWRSQLCFVPFGHRAETHPGPWRFRALFEASGSRDLARWCRHGYGAAYAWAGAEDLRNAMPDAGTVPALVVPTAA